MSDTSTREQNHPGQPDDGRLAAPEASTHHAGGHSMKWMMLLCIFGVIAGLVIGAGWSAIAGLFCAVMMIGMVWMMVAPAVARIRQRNHVGRP